MTSSVRSMCIAISFMALASCRHNAPSSKAKDITHKDELRDKYATLYSDKGRVFFKKCLPESQSFDRNCQVDGAIADKSTEDFETALPDDIQLRNRILCHLKQGSDFVSSTPPPATTTIAEKCKSFGPITSDDLAKAFGVFNYSMSPPSTNPGTPPTTTPGPELPGMRFIPVQGRNFAMAETETTRGQWKAVMGKYPEERPGWNDCALKEKTIFEDSHPVSCVSWNDANDFARKMGHNYRLPTQEEWGYAAGDIKGSTFGWCDTTSTQPVGKLKANNDLYDMVGNVREWTNSLYSLYYASGARIVRGGSLLDSAWDCNSASSNASYPDDRQSYVGFRVVRASSP